MVDSLKKFAEWNNQDTIEIPNVGIVSPHFDGETCWERTQPTFISKKRKVILTCPRKVGHSSIRFYLHAQNEMNGDDWIWLEDDNRNPKTWLEPEEFQSFMESIYAEDVRKVICKEKLSHHNDQNPFLKTANIMHINTKECIDCFGEYNKWDWVNSIAPEWVKKREFDMTPPFQTLPYFEDWTSYLLVRDPWERFKSGLITEMDNGMLCPWVYDMIANTEEGWERYYNSAKRMLYFTEPEHMLLGGLDGMQMNHTFILSRPKWEGNTMFDVYDNFIHYKHDIDYEKDKEGRIHPTVDSMKKTTGVLESLEELNFIGLEVKDAFQKSNPENMHAHTHMNITPPLRQAVIKELEDDEDLKEWWDRCREIINWDYDSLKNNQHKF